ncbi:Sua5/YciO/YrdC/YwlC family protein [Mycoplasmopsis verecunda]|uniref:L-threonylcarbamoyladenylate synthase n=1 Tax=Mycoplasmopsis verecunda TaxID=171291 RepID=A0A1T4LEW2_9BACT|nr:Sua5/YciO/YrdC/YwlC family protein [Mycoplasmopsis verecunda]WPB54840.1 Sua5/YciO/YrdC/YwlC family protein [Mycoplasmopsis verecunda]SJZ53332.1 tRNA A37 threonylcarbamoyladenosine synthetase subunit TsaC/SUA5/YrdC [Mycoplasmopsis verecunda]
MQNNKYQDIIICTTDTVCGIGGPVNNNTLELLYELKNRPKNKKIMILVGSLEQARQFKQWNEQATKLAEEKWPGAVSIIVNDQGFRMPNCPTLQQYLITNGPIYMTSANLSGQETLSIDQVANVFPMVKNIFAFCSPSGKPSDIYNLDTNDVIIREK